MTAHEEPRVEFETVDGVTLTGDLVVPDEPWAAAIVCHPHPQYGGNRFNPVVESLHRRLPTVGVASLRFDFRPAFDDGHGERLDAQSALHELRRRVPEVPLLVCGYSFGALVGMSLDDPDVDGRVLVAPPLGNATAEPVPAVPTLVLTPAHDQFAPPDVARPIVEAWSAADFEVIEMVDHFMAARTAEVADRVTEWVSGRWPSRSPR